MIQKLIDQIEQKKAPIVVGLDPTLAIIPQSLQQKYYNQTGETMESVGEAILSFNRAIVDAVCDLIPAVKPQIAMYEAFGIPGLIAYRQTVEYCRDKGLVVIGDAKRGDIGSTSAAYADAHIGRTVIGERSYQAFNEDFVTVNPYLGSDGVRPFIEVCRKEDRGIFVLVKTSNPSSGEFQDQLVGDEKRPLYELVAEQVAAWGEESMDGDYSNVGAVVGATYPQMAASIRKLIPKACILVPGYGAQGASGKDLKAFFNADGRGAIVNSSRGIIAAYQNEKYAQFGEAHYAEASRQAVLDMIEDIRGAIG